MITLMPASGAVVEKSVSLVDRLGQNDFIVHVVTVIGMYLGVPKPQTSRSRPDQAVVNRDGSCQCQYGEGNVATQIPSDSISRRSGDFQSTCFVRLCF